MPKLGADMDRGRILRWRKQVGEAVHKGEILAEVETDKADIEAEAYHDGVLERILVEPGEWVPVGTPLAILRVEGEVEAPEPAKAAISPAARKRAAELGVEASRASGTGPGGRITLEDVEALAAQPLEQDAPTRMRRAIAAAMSRSKREIPHYYLATTIDLQRASAWLREANAARAMADRLLMGALLCKAVAHALRRHPEFNGFFVDGRTLPGSGIHLGLAVSLRTGGLLAPAIRDADTLALGELGRRMQDLVQRAREGGLKASELADPTVTVTSLGDQGVEFVQGVIIPPQVAMVGFGKVVERPWAVEGRVEIRPVVMASLSADHRVSDGHRGARFLAEVDRRLQAPEEL